MELEVDRAAEVEVSQCGVDRVGFGVVVDQYVALVEIELEAFDVVDIGQRRANQLFFGGAVHAGNVETNG